MIVYDESGNVLEIYDLSAGHIEERYDTVAHPEIEPVDEVWHYEVLNSYSNGGKDVERVIDVPGVIGRPEWTENVTKLVYIPYTEEELKQINDEKVIKNDTDRISELEAEIMSLKIIINSLTKN